MGQPATGETGTLTLLRHDSAIAAAGAEDRSHGAENAARGTVLRTLLRFPLFYKILIANVAVMGMLVLGCAVLVQSAGGADEPLLGLLLASGIVVSGLTNAVILRLALQPLKALEHTAARISAGDLAARVPPSELADRQTERLATTFNGMLDAGDAYRRRLRDIAARALNATEEERKRIARELHDGTAQTLAALRVRLRVARSTTDSVERDALLERISEQLREATEEIRHIAQGLRPPALDMLGLGPAIESYARTVGETAGLLVETDIAPVEGLLPPEAELALYRIVQEAVSNVARHSGSHSARLRLDTAGGTVCAVVEDRGSGFDVKREMASSGLGLFGMQERGAYVGGTVEIDSEPGRGTRVRVTIPVVETARYA
jgi:two-component system, NarL family, sensor histidine kinase UhpB